MWPNQRSCHSSLHSCRCVRLPFIQVQQAEAQLSRVEVEKEELRQGLVGERERLMGDLQEVEGRARAEVTAQLDGLRGQLEAAQEERATLQQRVHDLEMEVQHARTELQDATAAAAAVALQQSSSETGEREWEVASLRQALETMQEERDLARQQRLVQLSGLAEEVAALKKELVALRAERDALTGQVGSFEGRVQQEIAKVLEAVEAERDGLKRQLEDLGDMGDYVSSLKATIKAVELERERLQEEVKGLEQKLCEGEDKKKGGEGGGSSPPHSHGQDIIVTPTSKTQDLKLHIHELMAPQLEEEPPVPSSVPSPHPPLVDTRRSSSSIHLTADWKEEVEVNPLPPFGLTSPVIEHLLRSW